MQYPTRLFDKPYRYRYIFLVIKLAVVLLAFLPSRDVKAILYYLFRARVSHKTICEWAVKFPLESPKEKIKYGEDETVILFADEKYTWIKNTQAYWWSVKDHLGNVLASIITSARDGVSAKELFRRARKRIVGKVHAVVHDGLKSYDQPINWIFGRRCKSVVAGIKGRSVIINNKWFWITNNSAESLNAQIDCFLARQHYNFNSLKSANRYVNMFLYRMNLRQVCT